MARSERWRSQATVDLEKKIVTDAHGFSTAFETGDFQRRCLLEGLDDIDLTLKHEAEIASHEQRRLHLFRVGLTPD